VCLGVGEPATEAWPAGSSGEEQGQGIPSPAVSNLLLTEGYCVTVIF